MENTQSRLEDMGDGMLTICEKEGEITIATTPHIDSITYTNSGGQSNHTLKALRELFYEIRKDNKEIPQERAFNDHDCQSRCEDTEEERKGLRGQIMVSSYADIKITITKYGPLTFKSPEKGGKSKYLYEAAKAILIAMQKDNEEHPQEERKERVKNTR